MHRPAPFLPPGDLDEILGLTRPLWEELRGGRLFVTGATGFFGKWMTRSFLHANDALGLGARMTLLVRDPARARAANPDLAGRPDVDLLPGGLVDFRFPDGAFSHALHLATQGFGGVFPAESLEKYRVNVAGTERMLEFAARSGVRKFLYTSSGAVYGPQPPALERIPEDHPQAADPENPASAYAMEKRTGEFLCAQWGAAEGFNAAIARCFAFVGPHLPLTGNYAAGNFLLDVLENRTVTIQGDGTPFRSYLYMSDLAAWLWTLLFRASHGRAYNVGSQEALSIRELAHLVARVGGRPGDVAILKEPVPGALPPRYVPSTARARDELGLGVHVSPEEAVRRTLAWHASQKN